MRLLDFDIVRINHTPEGISLGVEGAGLLPWNDVVGLDLWVLPLDQKVGDRKPMAYLHESFDEKQGQFSPGPEGSPTSAPRWRRPSGSAGSSGRARGW